MVPVRPKNELWLFDSCSKIETDYYREIFYEETLQGPALGLICLPGTINLTAAMMAQGECM